MRFYSATFFSEDKEPGPECARLGYDKNSLMYQTNFILKWPDNNARIYFHLNEQQLIAFKNSVLSIFNDYERKRKEQLDESSFHLIWKGDTHA